MWVQFGSSETGGLMNPNRGELLKEEKEIEVR